MSIERITTAAWLSVLAGLVAWAPSAARADHDAVPAALRAQADAALARGDLVAAAARLAELLRLWPGDAAAARDAGRVAQARGRFADAELTLARADRLAGGARDAELHYLRGEALYELHRLDEARAEHARAERELEGEAGRMATLWRARIWARRDQLARSVAAYGALLDARPDDAEVAMALAEAYVLARDFAGVARTMRAYLTHVPKHRRARELLAWALESKGDLGGELALRAELAGERSADAGAQADYARALERGGQYPQSLAQYRRAATLRDQADPELSLAVERLRLRTTPELATAFLTAADPNALSLRGSAGIALPFGSRHQVTLLAGYENARGLVAGGPLGGDTSQARLSGALALGARWGGRLTLGAEGRYSAVPRFGGDGTQHLFGIGGFAVAASPLGSHVSAEVEGQLNNAWTEAPTTVRLGGRISAVLTRLTAYPRSRRVIVELGAQARWLALPGAADAQGTVGADPQATQQLIFGGADVLLWSNSHQSLRGEILDERLLGRRDVADALVASYRHFELFSQLDGCTPAAPKSCFSAQLSLAPRASSELGTLSFHKVLARRRIGLELDGGGGYDWVRHLALAQAGSALSWSPTAAMRVSLSYSFAIETATGLLGQRQTGWLTYHADL